MGVRTPQVKYSQNGVVLCEVETLLEDLTMAKVNGAECCEVCGGEAFGIEALCGCTQGPYLDYDPNEYNPDDYYHEPEPYDDNEVDEDTGHGWCAACGYRDPNCTCQHWPYNDEPTF